MDFITISLFVVFFVNLILAYLLFSFKNKKSVNYFSLAVIGVALWNLSMALFRLTSGEALYFWTKGLYISAIVIAGGFLLFAYSFYKRNHPLGLGRIFLFSIPAFVMMVVIMFGFIYSGYQL